MLPILERHGWKRLGSNEKNTFMRRPGKDSGCHSASLLEGGKLFHVFSSNADPFEAGHTYSRFGVYSLLEHGGDFAQAASALAKMGFGASSDSWQGIGDWTSSAGAEGQGEVQGRGFRFLPLDELLATPQPPRWLIQDYLDEACLASIYGPSGTMKTFVGLDIGFAVASGRPWHGITVPAAGPVFYIAGEGFAGLGRRYKAWLTHHGVDPAGLPFFTSSAAVGFLDANSLGAAIAAIEELARDHGPPRLVVVDTLARNFGPGDENSTPDMSAFVRALDEVRTKFGCAVLVVHHTGLATADRARGSSAFRAALDWEYSLVSDDTHRFLQCSKSKDFEPPRDIAFEPDTVETGWMDDNDVGVLSIVLRRVEVKAPGKREKPLKGANKIALAALHFLCCKHDLLESSAIPVDIEAWRAECYCRSISPSSEQSSRQKAFKRAVNELRDRGHVLCEDELFWPAAIPRDTRTRPDKTGQMSDPVQTGPDNNLKGCPVLSGSGDLDQGVLA